jgi:rare lipoprotein A
VRTAALLALALGLAIAGCVRPRAEAAPATAEGAPAKRGAPARGEVRVGMVEHGRAVWYGGKHHGGPTASGERFDKRAMTAAHRTLPLGTRVRVTNQRNGRSVIVRINDRGPFGKDRRRVIDLSEAAARKLNYLRGGWTEVTIEVLEVPPPKAKRTPKGKGKRPRKGRR